MLQENAILIGTVSILLLITTFNLYNKYNVEKLNPLTPNKTNLNNPNTYQPDEKFNNEEDKSPTNSTIQPKATTMPNIRTSQTNRKNVIQV